MPVTAPTYAGTYGQSEQNTNAQTICTFIDTSNTNIGTNKTATVSALQAIKKVAFLSTGLLNHQKAIDNAIAAFA
jgi:hypothetical protein